MTDPHKQMGRVLAKARAENNRINLDALIAAVEAGSFPGDMCAADLKLPGIECIDEVYDVFSGSLDAAKALHDALLPGFDWCLTNDASHAGDEDGPAAMLARKSGGFEVQTQSPSPARAWLLAILKAYRATMEEA